MSDALNLTRSWVQPDGTIIDPASCGADDHDACEGDCCECPCGHPGRDS